MARALSRDTRLLILDEPSAVLDQEGVANLFRVIRGLTAEGVAVVYISHRLEEIRQIGDRITVLKDGRTVATGLPVAETPTAALIKLMTGRAIEYVFPPRPTGPPDGAVVLEVQRPVLARGLQRREPRQSARARSSGLAGLVGAGRSEILETLYGARRATTGTVTVRRQATAPRFGDLGRQGRCRACTGGAQEPGTPARRVGVQQHHGLLAGGVLAGRLPEQERRARAVLGADRRRWTSDPPG